MFGTGISRSFVMVNAPVAPAPVPELDLSPYLVPYGASAGRRSPLTEFALGTAMVAAMVGIGFADRAQAQACGALADDGSVVCGEGGNPFANGVAYQAPASGADLHVAVESGVAVEMPSLSLPVPAFDLSATGTAAVTLDAEQGSSILTYGTGKIGVRATSEAGAITIAAPDIVTVSNSAGGVLASSTDGGAVDVTARSIVTVGSSSRGVDARSTGGDVSVVANGPIVTYGASSSGVVANAGSGVASASVGDISTYGTFSDGVAVVGGSADAVVSGAVRVYGQRSYGAYVAASSGTGTVTLDGTIETFGNLGARGVSVEGIEGVSVVGSGSVVTHGSLSTAVVATTASGDAVVDLARVTTTRTGATGTSGVSASSTFGNVDVRLTDGETAGDYIRTISASSTYGSTAVASTGTIAATGSRSTAIDARGRDDVVIAVNDVTATGANSIAIRADGGAVDMTINGTVSATGGGNGYQAAVQATGVFDYTSPANATVAIVNDGAIVGAGGGMGGILASGYGGVVVSGTGAVTTDGANAVGIDIQSEGDIGVSMGSVTTAGSHGVRIDSNAGVAVDIGTLATTGDGADGIRLTAGGDAMLTVENGSTTGAGSAVINASASGSLGVLAGTLSTQGTQALAISAEAEGDVAIVAQGIATQGDDAIGINAISRSGSVAILADSVVTSGGRTYTTAYDPDYGEIPVFGTSAQGIVVQAQGDAAVGAGAVSTAGYAAHAINVASLYGNVTVAAGTISTQGSDARGVLGRAYGDLDITAGSIVTSGDYARGIDASSLYGTTTVIAGTVSTTGYSADAIRVNSGGQVQVGLASGSVSGAYSDVVRVIASQDVAIGVGDLSVAGYASRGVDATSFSNVAIQVDGTVTGSANFAVPEEVTTGPAGRTRDPATGIISANAFGQASVVNNGVIVTTGTLEAGIVARGYNGVVVSGNGSVSTAGAGATGVYAAANTGLAMATIGDVTTLGDDARAVAVRAYGVAVASADTVKTSGARALGVVVEGGLASYAQVRSVTTSGAAAHGVVSHSYGYAFAEAGLVSVTGAGALAINAASYGQGDARVIAGTVTVADGRGVEAFALNGAAFVQADSVVQASTQGGAAIFAGGSTGATIDFGKVQSSGAGSSGAVSAYSATGPITITGGSVTATGAARDGVLALSTSGAIAIAITQDVTTSGSGASGIFARTAGTVDITAQNVTTDGTLYAAIAATGSDVTVKSAEVVASGDNATSGALAAIAITASGKADATVGNVTASGLDRNGVAITAGGTGTLTVLSGGTVSATGDAVTLATGAGASLTNAGVIGSTLGAAVRALGASVTITNSGTISGPLVLTDGADLVTNTGTLRLGTGTSLGSGNDRLVNGGTVILAGNVDFGSGTDSFVNTGTLTLAAATSANARALAAPVSRTLSNLETFANSGLVELRNGVAGDVLTTSGAFVGSGASTLGLDVAFGTTTLADRLVIGGAATGSTAIALTVTGTPVLGRGPVLVQAGAGTSATAFALVPGTTVSGMFERGLVFDSQNNSFTLAVAPSTAAYRLTKLGEVAQSLWIESADSVAAHLTANREAGTAGSGLWFTATGGTNTRKETRTFNAFGFDQQANLGYRQDVIGGQLGIDFGTGNVGFGVTGGYANSVTGFAGSADRATFDAWNLGVYASVASKAFFANALVQYDFLDVDARIQNVTARGKGHVYGARGEVGFSIGSAALHIEPVASISWQHVALDALAFPLAVRFGDLEGGRASGGLRFSTQHEIGGGSLLNVYAQGDFVQPFGGSAATTFSTGATGVTFKDERIGAYGKARLGLSITTGPVTGFIEGEARTSGEYRGGSGKAGLRIAF